jgi:hypothetical protein
VLTVSGGCSPFASEGEAPDPAALRRFDEFRVLWPGLRRCR